MPAAVAQSSPLPALAAGPVPAVASTVVGLRIDAAVDLTVASGFSDLDVRGRLELAAEQQHDLLRGLLDPTAQTAYDLRLRAGMGAGLELAVLIRSWDGSAGERDGARRGDARGVPVRRCRASRPGGRHRGSARAREPGWRASAPRRRSPTASTSAGPSRSSSPTAPTPACRTTSASRSSTGRSRTGAGSTSGSGGWSGRSWSRSGCCRSRRRPRSTTCWPSTRRSTGGRARVPADRPLGPAPARAGGVRGQQRAGVPRLPAAARAARVRDPDPDRRPPAGERRRRRRRGDDQPAGLQRRQRARPPALGGQL